MISIEMLLDLLQNDRAKLAFYGFHDRFGKIVNLLASASLVAGSITSYGKNVYELQTISGYGDFVLKFMYIKRTYGTKYFCLNRGSICLFLKKRIKQTNNKLAISVKHIYSLQLLDFSTVWLAPQ